MRFERAKLNTEVGQTVAVRSGASPKLAEESPGSAEQDAG
jgi:hypothetical protein